MTRWPFAALGVRHRVTFYRDVGAGPPCPTPFDAPFDRENKKGRPWPPSTTFPSAFSASDGVTESQNATWCCHADLRAERGLAVPAGVERHH